MFSYMSCEEKETEITICQSEDRKEGVQQAMKTTLEKIEKDIAEQLDIEIAKTFVKEAGRTLEKEGIRLWLTQKPIRQTTEEKDDRTVLTTTYELAFNHVDTVEHDERVINKCIEALKDKWPMNETFILSEVINILEAVKGQI